ncbi:MAG TPA: hypothetical protein VEI83_13700 [Acidimicrobiales bacterium]|nr:hypothetical protein [Acidimicrobiales bacterium]
MTEITFTADDVQSLAAKLDAFQPQLSEREHALLLCVIRLAHDRVEEQTEVSGFGFGAPSFRAAFNLGMPSLGGAFTGGSGGWGQDAPGSEPGGTAPGGGGSPGGGGGPAPTPGPGPGPSGFQVMF